MWTSWNRPVSISAFRPSSICGLAQPTARPGMEIGADGFELDAAVPLHRDRIDASAQTQAQDTATAAKVATTGTANMTRAANKPPGLAFQTSCATRPYLTRCRTVPQRRLTDSQLHRSACSQFRRRGKLTTAEHFHFVSKTLPIGNATKKPASGPGDSEDVVIRREHHQHQNQTQPDLETHLLRPLRQRRVHASASRAVEQQGGRHPRSGIGNRFNRPIETDRMAQG